MPLLTKLQLDAHVADLRLRASRAEGFEKLHRGTMVLTFDGPKDDCHAGLTRPSDSRTLQLYKRNTPIRNVRQLTLLSIEELADIAAALSIPNLDAGWFGGNIITSGIPELTLMPPSTRLQFPSGATIVVDMENLPCSQIAAAVGQHHPGVEKQVVKRSMNKRGVTAWVECEGAVLVGDPITVWIPPQRLYQHGQ